MINKKIEQTIKKEKKVIITIAKQATMFGLIKTNTELVNATECLVKIKQKLDSLENERLEYSKPLNVVLKKINNGFKELTAPLKEAQVFVKNAICEYREKKEIERLTAEKQLQKMNGKNDLIVETILPDIIESRSGEIRTVRRWTFEIMNENEIPRKYLMPNVQKINDAIRKEEIREIKGLRIYQKEDISVYEG